MSGQGATGAYVLYVAGPMTGLPEFNYPAFREAETRLRDRGYGVLNPARTYEIEPTSWKGYMVRALADVASSDGLALLPGWERSRGARLEVQVAFALDVEVRELAAWLAEEAVA